MPAINALRPLGSGLLVLLALLSCWAVWHYILQPAPLLPANPRNPDQFAENVQITVFDTAGKPAYQFFSPRLVHFPQDDYTRLWQPRVLLYDAPQAPWQFSAQWGEAWQGDQRIDLSGQVTALQAASAANPMTRVVTARATLYPRQRLITSADKVVAEQPPVGILQGVGMRLDLNQQTLNLLSQVEGTYVPTHKSIAP